ncbi:MAG: DUF2804 domain-containing protein [Christensenellaceae bacterium]|jgi:hypothetical protein|nr:DUF2804 domain-containing protein [Christensenellaceae bacterium]
MAKKKLFTVKNENQRQNEITTPQKVLNEKGDIANPGWAKRPLYEYHKKDIGTSKWRLKEWDCFVIWNQEVGMTLTISDVAFIGIGSILINDFYTAKKPVSVNAIKPFPLGNLNLPESSYTESTVEIKSGGVELKFERTKEGRHLTGSAKKFGKEKKPISVDLTLFDESPDTTYIATPFDKPAHFYFNQKINCMKVKGTVVWGDRVIEFKPEETLATLDWGRGVWTYENIWLWSSFNTYLEDGSTLGWNLGYGFGDTRAATENILFYNGVAHKLDEVFFDSPYLPNGKDDFETPFDATSNDGRFEVHFEPVFDSSQPLNIGVVAFAGHSIFGKFSGKVVLDDGTVVEFKDRMGFWEKFHNKW